MLMRKSEARPAGSAGLEMWEHVEARAQELQVVLQQLVHQRRPTTRVASSWDSLSWQHSF